MSKILAALTEKKVSKFKSFVEEELNARLKSLISEKVKKFNEEDDEEDDETDEEDNEDEEDDEENDENDDDKTAVAENKRSKAKSTSK